MFKVVKNYEHIAFAYTFGKKVTLSLNAFKNEKKARNITIAILEK